MCSSTIKFSRSHIVQISSLAQASIGQPLLTFWSHTEQSWMFAMIVAALKVTYTALHRYRLNLKAIVPSYAQCKCSSY